MNTNMSLGLGATSPDTDTIVGARGDVLDSKTEYWGWEADLREQHGVLHPNLNLHPPAARKDWFWCETCGKTMPSWSQVPIHIKGKRHQSKVAAAPSVTTSGVCVPPPSAALDTEGWPPLLRYGQALDTEGWPLEEADSELSAGVGPNATAPGDDRTPLFWAAWEGHHLVVERLLREPRARELAKAACQGLRDVPPHPTSPLEAAHDRWGDSSDTFAAVGRHLVGLLVEGGDEIIASPSGSSSDSDEIFDHYLKEAMRSSRDGCSR